jgi:hypothetical protein
MFCDINVMVSNGISFVKYRPWWIAVADFLTTATVFYGGFKSWIFGFLSWSAIDNTDVDSLWND